MKYRQDKKGNSISQLGYGCMRFTRNRNSIDFEKAESEVMEAFNSGVNYFDTAYIYPGSEECLGKILAKNNIRDKVYIATKLPQYIMKNSAAIDKTFNEELKRLQTDYIDFYLMHMFTDYSEWEHLQSLGIEEWIKARKAEGSIRNIGFSYHGDTEMFIKILEAYDWDFCQIQYNYLDEHSQAGKRGLQAAAAKGLPVIIMEPLRGGKLVNLPEEALKKIKESGRDYSAAELGLRWLWNQPEVTCVLSGMNSLEMVQENVRIASEAETEAFDEHDFELTDAVKRILKEREKVGCTGCRYCMPCPMGVDIPGNFYYYNLMYIDKKSQARFAFVQNIGVRNNPGYASLCVNCGKCEQHCPQHLPIREKLKEADKELRPWNYKVINYLMRKIMLKNKTE